MPNCTEHIDAKLSIHQYSTTVFDGKRTGSVLACTFCTVYARYWHYIKPSLYNGRLGHRTCHYKQIHYNLQKNAAAPPAAVIWLNRWLVEEAPQSIVFQKSVRTWTSNPAPTSVIGNCVDSVSDWLPSENVCPTDKKSYFGLFGYSQSCVRTRAENYIYKFEIGINSH